jgi:uracil-DNA glycosylase family 4
MQSLRSLSAVADAVIACERCSRLRTYCQRIAAARRRAFRDQEYWGRPVPGYGDPKARLFILGLAPAAHGGNRTGRVFTGDSSGNWLYGALHHFGFSNQPDSSGRDDGLVLTDCYVSAAARCAPPANKPTPAEFENCREYLEAELRLLSHVRLTLTLGHLAHDRWLRAAGWWDRLSPSERPRFAHGAEHVLPDGRWLMCAYHPSRQNTNTGRLTQAMWLATFRRARALLDGRAAFKGARREPAAAR